MSKKFKVTQVRSEIGCTQTQIATLKALGLNGVHRNVEMSDNPANRGQIRKVQHLVKVEILR